MIFDLAIVETGNGGDIQLLSNDLAVVNGIENMPYLAMYGGNPGFNTVNVTTNPVPAQSFDWWGNNLLMTSNQSIQFNSKLENIVNTTPLTSSGRLIIENAIKDDLRFMSDFSTISVSVSIMDIDRINVNIKTNQDLADEKVTVVNFKKASDGDWFIFDFNEDFNV